MGQGAVESLWKWSPIPRESSSIVPLSWVSSQLHNAQVYQNNSKITRRRRTCSTDFLSVASLSPFALDSQTGQTRIENKSYPDPTSV